MTRYGIGDAVLFLNRSPSLHRFDHQSLEEGGHVENSQSGECQISLFLAGLIVQSGVSGCERGFYRMFYESSPCIRPKRLLEFTKKITRPFFTNSPVRLSVQGDPSDSSQPSVDFKQKSCFGLAWPGQVWPGQARLKRNICFEVNMRL